MEQVPGRVQGVVPIRRVIEYASIPLQFDRFLRLVKRQRDARFDFVLELNATKTVALPYHNTSYA